MEVVSFGCAAHPSEAWEITVHESESEVAQLYLTLPPHGL